ncbi:DUF3199 family protein [Listeria ivanovii subsp. londoniensis]|uniref:protein YqbG n=1 Tax=Listeria ivanovii TaxID=1638 RepID=UPI00190641D2|nr:DUF3199 family protein [Listeria ivanovii]EHH5516362.1 DUF3199 family protein [Listeria monocytogenes]EJZ0334580.1 DUF3199 family protein [Listeria monocytogenes]EJZ0534144.1 DUF3199 family protein [Listeria monocytogenes]EKH9261000.1 DUF3199 family protein [Listeria monocytogenes]MBK1994981.1 DUF3199 family protein [Listeria ivanovii subsp. londoniensis]
MSYITSDDLIAYSDFDAVKERNPEKLEMDILEAEMDLQAELGKSLADITNKNLEETGFPKALKLALLRLSQFRALYNTNEAMQKGYSSEKIADYSYSLANGESINYPDVSNLIADYLDEKSTDKRKFRFRMGAF